MALYDLVSLKKALTNSLDVSYEIKTLTDLSNRISTIKTQVPNLSTEHSAFVDKLSQYYINLSDVIEKSTNDTKNLIDEVTIQINNLAHELFTDSYELEERTGGLDHVRKNRKLVLNEDVEQTIKQRIMLYTNWRYPALEIGCRDGEWTQFLVAADPLYIMDPWQEFLESASSQFPAQYQARLRKYPLKDYNLSALPKNQFAFVFSWGHFNYVSLDTITQVLKQLQTLLRPGGVFLFSYNDGDTPEGAGMAEHFMQTYIPKSLLVPLCQSLGFELLYDFNFGNITWLEIKKPGVLHTVKAHQVLGEIKRREDYQTP